MDLDETDITEALKVAVTKLCKKDWFRIKDMTLDLTERLNLPPDDALEVLGAIGRLLVLRNPPPARRRNARTRTGL